MDSILTIPAGAFGIELIEHSLVGFASPFEAVGEFGFFDFVVVINESGGFVEGIGVVGWRR